MVQDCCSLCKNHHGNLCIIPSSNDLVAVSFSTRPTIRFCCPSVAGMSAFFISFPYFTPVMMRWWWSDMKLQWASFKCWGGDKKARSQLRTPAKTTRHCWVALVYIRIDEKKKIKKCCQAFPTVTRGACGRETADYAPFLSLPMSPSGLSKINGWTSQRKDVARALCEVWLTNVFWGKNKASEL